MSRSRIDDWTKWLLGSVALAACLLVGLILWFLGAGSLPALQSVGSRFMTDASWHPAAEAEAGSFAIVPMILGSLLITAGSVSVAAPIGLASAIFCQFYAPQSLAWGYRRLVQLLAGIPSVVFGFWGLVVLVPWIASWQSPGPSLLAGTIVVALMILPTVMLLADASLAAVPRSFIIAAASLGMGRWSIVRSIAIPAARSGIAMAILLGATRAVGETMAVVMVCGNVVQVPQGLFDPVRTLTANIALEMGYAMGDHRSSLFVSGLVLLILAGGMIAAVDFVSRKTPQPRSSLSR